MAAEIVLGPDQCDEVVLTTCPRDCYDACGIAVVTRDGAIRHVRGDPAHPVSRGKLCPKCSIGYNGAYLDPQARLTRPLRRVGAKGEGRFVETSWEDALDLIHERFTAIMAAHGPQAIVPLNYAGPHGMLAGGSMDLRSEPGQGTVLLATFPIERGGEGER